MCGLCGNYDGKQENDFTTPDGYETSVDYFGESWKTEEDEDDSWVSMRLTLCIIF